MKDRSKLGHDSIFKHLKIIDLSTVLAGPSVGSFFAELGAKVIKIEHPTHGDITNTWRLPQETDLSKQSAYYASVNFQKELIKLDLSAESAYDLFVKELIDAHIILINFKKGDDAKLKVRPEDLWAINPSLIIGKITGFGSKNDRIAYDLILQAETGFMAMNGTPESGPVKMPVALIDVLAAHQLKEGLLLALLQSAQDPKGRVVSVSLYDAAICSLANQAANYLMSAQVPQRMGSLHPNIAPYGEIFQSKDDKLLTFAIGSDQHFHKLLSTLNLLKLEDEQKFKSNIARVKNRTALAQIIQEKVGELLAEPLLSDLQKLGVPAAQIQTLDQVFANPNAQELVRVEQIDGQSTKRVSQIAFNFKT
jgi:crotonobetainyl-CoA:carnitine CoA-transferase CaiB-like acyl-CoA transferase